MVADRLSVAGFTFTDSIGIDPATKMLRPLPAYLISSLWLSNFRSSVGSRRGSTTGTVLPEAVRRVPGLAEDVEVCVNDGVALVDEGQNS